MKTVLGYLNAKDFGACGSDFETVGSIVAGSSCIEVEDVGDFEVGQQLKMYGCVPRCDGFWIWGPKTFHGKHRPVQGEVLLRGWDASNGDHAVYFLDIDRENPTVFRWTDDQGRTWHENETLDREWHLLSGGLEVCFSDYEWENGYTITIVMRASMEAKILE